MYCFETLVRIHQAGEGAPHTGLNPAGLDSGPAIPAADKALKECKTDSLYKLLTSVTHDGFHEKYNKVMSKKNLILTISRREENLLRPM
jgi:hypothetical protein